MRRAVKVAMATVLFAGMAAAQKMEVPKVVPVPPLPPMKPREAPKPPPEPTNPPAQTVQDERAHVQFHLPAGWEVSRRDGEISTFRLDARTAPRTAQLRVAASLGFNPFPQSTFSGAVFYLSVAAHSTAIACAGQAKVTPEKALEPIVVGDVKFSRGRDEHGHICTEARDVVYTAIRGGSCVRFDLAVNSFCGGDDSGAQDLTEAQIASLFQRMVGILDTVEFRAK